MIISHKYKFIFIKTKKTAGTSIEVYLSQFCSSKDIVTPTYPPIKSHKARNFRGFTLPLLEILKSPNLGAMYLKISRTVKGIKYLEHMRASQIKKRISKTIWDEYYKFCVERNPWDKVVSHYHMIKWRENSNLKFYDYLKRNKFPINLPLYTIKNDEIIIDKILKYEDLNNELASTFSKLGIPFNGKLDVRVKSEYRNDKRHYRDYYNNESKKIIENAFKKEIELHRYQF